MLLLLTVYVKPLYTFIEERDPFPYLDGLDAITIIDSGTCSASVGPGTIC